MKRKPAKTEIQNFEVSLEQLKSIVSQLENGKLTLSESLQRYEEGIKFLTECHAALNSAQMKIEQLVKLDEQGRLLTKPFDDTASFDNSSSGKSARTSNTSTSGRYSPPTDSVLANKKTLDHKPPAAEIETAELGREEAWESDEELDHEDLTVDSAEPGNAKSDAESGKSDRELRSGSGRASTPEPPPAQRGFLDFDEEN